MQRFARPAEPCKEIKPGEFEEKPSKIGTSNWDIPPGGVLPYMGYIGMCRCEGYGFHAVYSRIGYINQSIWV